jgi:hypothetical protein
MLIMDWNKHMLIMLSDQNRLNILLRSEIERKSLHIGIRVDVFRCSPFPSAATLTLPKSLASTLLLMRNLAVRLALIKRSLPSRHIQRLVQLIFLSAASLSLGLPFSTPKSNERFSTSPQHSFEDKALSEDEVLRTLTSHPTNILVNKESSLGARVKLLRVGSYRIAPTGFPYSANASFAILARAAKSVWIFDKGDHSKVAIPATLCGENALFLPPPSAIALVIADDNTSKDFLVLPIDDKLKPQCPTERVAL